MSQGFRSLVVWQKGVSLTKEIYIVTDHLPKHETYGLLSQMQRAAVSIPANLAEGSKRGTPKDFAQFIRIALGSAAELETHITIARQIYPSLQTENAENLLNEISGMLVNLLKKVKLNA